MRELGQKNLSFNISPPAIRLGVREDDIWLPWAANWCKTWSSNASDIKKHLCLCAIIYGKQRFSTTLKEPTGLSLINELYLESLYAFFFLFFFHQFKAHFKACINLHIGITITFLGVHHKNTSTVCLAPHPSKLKAIFLCTENLETWHNSDPLSNDSICWEGSLSSLCSNSKPCLKKTSNKWKKPLQDWLRDYIQVKLLIKTTSSPRLNIAKEQHVVLAEIKLHRAGKYSYPTSSTDLSSIWKHEWFLTKTLVWQILLSLIHI